MLHSVQAGIPCLPPCYLRVASDTTKTTTPSLLLLVASCQVFLLQLAYLQCLLVHAFDMPSSILPHPRVHIERNFIMGKAKGPLTTHRSLEIRNSSLS